MVGFALGIQYGYRVRQVHLSGNVQSVEGQATSDVRSAVAVDGDKHVDSWFVEPGHHCSEQE